MVANVNTTVYTVPVGKLSTVNISFCNRATVATKVRIALAATDAPESADYILYDAAIAANATLERTGIVLQESVKIVVYASTADISAVVYGMEE